MNKQLELVAASYDKGIELGRKGIDSYENFPEYITKDPEYELFLKMRQEVGLSDSSRTEIVDFLSPSSKMNFIDLGCCLNFLYGGYKDWPSTYHGVDISSKTIELLQKLTEKKQLSVGSFQCCSMHQTPFETSFFDIGACIGSLEYFEKDFVEKVILEAHRIIKPDGKFVLDVPDLGSPEFSITMKIEAYLGREDKYDLSPEEFEQYIRDYFKIEKKEKVGPMIQYFLTCTNK
ncbi:class I SAM-dependent methyltransferase [Lacrimispora xylanolytica]|uniref:Class I SAM-dependent methyltransferase n=1 Tax=Lacrimispora xylanolytica TaxID=29375 RepID=A0ABY7AA15_9FIRM|nr:class I SAM-dependent methyltransferase [Lacrimispora xylanolytica]WAJ22423.1 class I SAM-dependent methyltransferase [Lacrimispora xylanolytica]